MKQLYIILLSLCTITYGMASKLEHKPLEFHQLKHYESQCPPPQVQPGGQLIFPDVAQLRCEGTSLKSSHAHDYSELDHTQLSGWMDRDSWVFLLMPNPDMSQDPEIKQFEEAVDNHDIAGLEDSSRMIKDRLENLSWIDRSNRYKNSRRLSFLIKHLHMQKEGSREQWVAPIGGQIYSIYSHIPSSSRDTTDMTTQAPLLDIYQTNDPFRERFFEIYYHISQSTAIGEKSEQQIFHEVHQQMAKEGLISEKSLLEESPELMSEMAKGFAEGLNPIELAKDVGELGKAIVTGTGRAIIYQLTTSEEDKQKDAVEFLEQTLAAWKQLDLSQMPRKKVVRATGHFIGQIVAGKLMAKGATLATGAMKKGAAVLSEVAEGTKAAEVATVDGVIFRAPQAVEDTSILKSTAEKGAREAVQVAENSTPKWISYDYKHVASKNMKWKDVVKSTTSGVAKYKHEVDVKSLEIMAWAQGQPVAGKPWKVFECKNIIGAKNGVDTCYMVVKNSANTIHGHPITLQEYAKYLRR